MKLKSETINRAVLSNAYLLITSIACVLVIAFGTLKIHQLQVIDISPNRLKGLLTLGVILVAAVCFTLFAIIRIETRSYIRMKNIRDQQTWMINALNFHLDAIYSHIDVSRENNDEELDEPTKRWPWGSHHTEHLAHMEAAAKKFWTLYDKSDITTAPTNDMVAEWLQTQRNVSKDKAKAIASILRADGLPTGRRS